MDININIFEKRLLVDQLPLELFVTEKLSHFPLNVFSSLTLPSLFNSLKPQRAPAEALC